jgi:hypothetical protein
MELRADPWKRIQFYVDHGLVERLPTPDQLKVASRANRYGAGVVERLRYYARRPWEMLPTRRKADLFAMRNEDIVKEGYAVALESGGASATPEPPTGLDADLSMVDRTLKRAFLFSPLRFGVQCIYNPWNAIPSTGLEIPARFLISHVVHAHHPTALWDVQILHTDPGALDALEREIERAESGTGVTPRVYRALVHRPGYYDYLRDLIGHVREFDYPATPPGFNPVLENLVNFLNHARTI